MLEKNNEGHTKEEVLKQDKTLKTAQRNAKIKEVDDKVSPST